MPQPISPAWTHVLRAANWAAAPHAYVAPAHLSRAARKQPADSWQAAAFRGAAQASRLVHAPVSWVAGGAAIGATGLSTLGVAGAVAAYPVARLAFGDGVARGTAQKPADAWHRLQTSGVMGLPERLCLHTAQHSGITAIPGCRSALLGLAVGLRALIQVPRAAMGLVSGAVALGGAALGVLAHALARACAALVRLPKQVVRLVAKLRAHYAYWTQVLQTATAAVDTIHRAHARACSSWQRIAGAACTWRGWALGLPERFSLQLGRKAATKAASAGLVHQPQSLKAPTRDCSGAAACLQGARAGAQAAWRTAQSAGWALARIQHVMMHIAQRAAQAQRSPQVAWARSQLSAALRQLPQRAAALRLPAV